jgi:hypothetical protein
LVYFGLNSLEELPPLAHIQLLNKDNFDGEMTSLGHKGVIIEEEEFGHNVQIPALAIDSGLDDQKNQSNDIAKTPILDTIALRKEVAPCNVEIGSASNATTELEAEKPQSSASPSQGTDFHSVFQRLRQADKESTDKQ